MLRLSFLLLLILSLLSCSDKYLAFKSNYQFKSKDGSPDYSNPDYWAAHPRKQDPADSIPKPLRNEPRDTSADVFFIHPTTFTLKMKLQQWNANIDDDYTNAKTDYSTILYQASVFNNQCRVFAPRYRQAHINAFFTSNKEVAQKAFDLAYADIKKAFDYYLQNFNNGRPIIIAGHSQGAKMAERLLKEYFFAEPGKENKPLQKQLVAAYVIGWSLPKDLFSSNQICNDALQTGCICSWRTYRKNYIPYYIKKENGSSYVTNPLTWTIDGGYAPRSSNKGSLLTNFNKIYKQTTDAQISNGVVWVKKPQFPFSFLYLTKNYHVGDINLYYMNMRENIAQRIQSFKKK